MFPESVIQIGEKKWLVFKTVRKKSSFMENKWERICDGFCAMQNISNVINGAVRSQSFSCVAEAIISYSLK